MVSLAPLRLSPSPPSCIGLPGAQVFDLRSRRGCDYRIFVSIPAGATATSPFPVLYFLDGNATFPIAAVSAALQARRPQATGVGPAVIVGIGYPGDDYLDTPRRTFDYTPAVTADEMPARPDGSSWPRCGGASVFLDFIEQELKPKLESEIAIDRQKQALFGHSFGGLLVLQALFTRPNDFSTYIAASPSIWFAKRQLLEQAGCFIAQSRDRTSRLDLLVTVGALEQDARGAENGSFENTTWRRRNRMVENASEMVRYLSDHSNSGLNVSFKEFADENHSSVLPAAISRAIAFALGSKR